MTRSNAIIIRCLTLGLFNTLLLFPQLSLAQNSRLQSAEENFERGRFSNAYTLLWDTEKGEPITLNDGNENLKVRILLIKVLLAQDSLSAAVGQTEELLKGQPWFYPTTVNHSADFVDLVSQVRESLARETVSSVSKIAEQPGEAPASLNVITEEEIKRRGYNDLVELLKDQPGFDIIGLFGATYANIYQRGYRSTNTERTLLLIDGVEENDLYFNIPYISRQYPISNIKQVEIIYGPASTMYGPNAFVGVINVVTKNNAGRNGKPTGDVQIGGGSYASLFADASVGNSSKDGRITWEITGRVFSSQEMDLSQDDSVGYDFDYDPSVITDHAGYAATMGHVVDESVSLADLGLPDSHPYFYDSVAGGSRYIIPTTAGIEAARAADLAWYTENMDGTAINGFSNPSLDYYLRGKLTVDRLQLSFQHWTRQEGTSPRYKDVVAAPSINGTRWTPQNFTLTAQYSSPLNDDGTWSFNSLTSYRYHRLRPEFSNIVFARNFYRGNLDVVDLVVSESDPYHSRKPIWVNRNFFQEARQLRTEQKFVYAELGKPSWVSGIEVRNSQLQGDYLVTYDTVNVIDDSTATYWPDPQTYGIVNSNQDEGGNQYGMWDVGIYTQVQWHVISSLKLVGGVRIDYNQIRRYEGFRWAINPRLAAVYADGPWIAKGIFARGIQNPSQWSRYSTGSTRVPSVNLQEETINNFEVSARRNILASNGETKGFVEASAFYSLVNDVVGLRTIPNGETDAGKKQNVNIGDYTLYGGQVIAQWQPLDYLSLWGNYSFTYGQVSGIANNVDTASASADGFATGNRIADIAPHQVKLGAHGTFLDNRLQTNLRGQFVSFRPTGGKTTNPDNIGEIGTGGDTYSGIFRPYFLLYATIGWDFGQWVEDKNLGYGLTAQVSFNNILNWTHYNSGPLNGDGTTNPSLIPQRGFNGQIRVLYNF